MNAYYPLCVLAGVLLPPALVASCTPGARPVREQSSGLLGAWLIVETTRTTPDSAWMNENPQPGLYIFTDRHFSIMLIPGDSPRTNLFPNAPPEQRLAAFEDFIADAGSYEATDTLLTMRNVIAKVPDVMNSGAGGPYRYWLDGDTLTLSFTAGWAAGGETIYRLVRLE